MSCLSDIVKAITNSCTNVPALGMEVKSWIINRADVTWAIDGANVVLLDAATMAGVTVAYAVTAVKKESNVGFDGVFADNLPDLFAHNYSFQPYARDAASILALDSIDDIVLVVELKGPKTEGCFIVLGYETGLHLVSMSYKAKDNNGIPTYEFATREGEGEKYSRYVLWDTDYDTTLAALVTLEGL